MKKFIPILLMSVPLAYGEECRISNAVSSPQKVSCSFSHEDKLLGEINIFCRDGIYRFDKKTPSSLLELGSVGDTSSGQDDSASYRVVFFLDSEDEDTVLVNIPTQLTSEFVSAEISSTKKHFKFKGQCSLNQF